MIPVVLPAQFASFRSRSWRAAPRHLFDLERRTRRRPRRCPPENREVFLKPTVSRQTGIGLQAPRPRGTERAMSAPPRANRRVRRSAARAPPPVHSPDAVRPRPRTIKTRRTDPRMQLLGSQIGISSPHQP